jgi:hypothetical protein
MGIAMFLLYFVFVAVSLGFQYDYIICPIGPQKIRIPAIATGT